MNVVSCREKQKKKSLFFLGRIIQTRDKTSCKCVSKGCFIFNAWIVAKFVVALTENDDFSSKNTVFSVIGKDASKIQLKKQEKDSERKITLWKRISNPWTFQHKSVTRIIDFYIQKAGRFTSPLAIKTHEKVNFLTHREIWFPWAAHFHAAARSLRTLCLDRVPNQNLLIVPDSLLVHLQKQKEKKNSDKSKLESTINWATWFSAFHVLFSIKVRDHKSKEDSLWSSSRFSLFEMTNFRRAYRFRCVAISISFGQIFVILVIKNAIKIESKWTNVTLKLPFSLNRTNDLFMLNWLVRLHTNWSDRSMFVFKHLHIWFWPRNRAWAHAVCTQNSCAQIDVVGDP